MCPGSTQPLKNEYQDTSGDKDDRCVRLTTYHLQVPMSRNLEALTSRALWAPEACSGNALPLYILTDHAWKHWRRYVIIKSYDEPRRSRVSHDLLRIQRIEALKFITEVTETCSTTPDFWNKACENFSVFVRVRNVFLSLCWKARIKFQKSSVILCDVDC
jgi:hypothetical protein